MEITGKKIGFIGAGAMAEAIIKGLLSGKVIEPKQLFINDIDKQRLETIAERYDLQTAASNIDLLSKADIIIAAVKPQVIRKVLADLEGIWSERHLLVSIAAGVKLQELEKHTGNIPVVRVMPNTPCLIGAGASGISPGVHAEEKHVTVTDNLFGAVGKTFVLEEKLLDAVTGLSGSGPAYVYLFIEALADGGVREGLPRKIALQLAAQTVLGSAAMVLETQKHPGELKDMVSSPAGTTIEAIGSLESRGFRGTVMEAVQVAAASSRKLTGNGG